VLIVNECDNFLSVSREGINPNETNNVVVFLIDDQWTQIYDNCVVYNAQDKDNKRYKKTINEEAAGDSVNLVSCAPWHLIFSNEEIDVVYAGNFLKNDNNWKNDWIGPILKERSICKSVFLIDHHDEGPTGSVGVSATFRRLVTHYKIPPRQLMSYTIGAVPIYLKVILSFMPEGSTHHIVKKSDLDSSPVKTVNKILEIAFR